MAVPTQPHNKSTSIDSMGVPVLFSIKNVQPLILAARPTAELNHQHSVGAPSVASISTLPASAAANGTVAAGTPTPATAPNALDTQQKARRSGLLSKAIATGFVIMLIIVVIQFSVPPSKQPSDVADTVSGNKHDAVVDLVTGPELTPSSETNPGGEITRIASAPVTPEFNLGTVESKSNTPAPEVPVLPPLLSESRPKESPVGTPDSSTSASLPPSIMSIGAPVADTPNIQLDNSKLGKPELPSNAPTLDLSQHNGSNGSTGSDPASSSGTPQLPNGSGENLHVLETLTPERSLAEFEWLFRNATKTPLVPYRPVSAGSQDSGIDQALEPGMTAPLTGAGPVAVPNRKTATDGPAAYQPLTIPVTEAVPAYEKNLPGQTVNRYQQRIRQPQQNSQPESKYSDPSPTSVPYQPLVVPDSPPAGVNATSFGYPPVQYSPTIQSTTENSSVQIMPGQR
jgi:hypothetical protein